MNKHATVSLDENSADFVEKQVEDGNYSSPDDVVRAGLELLADRQIEIDSLRGALIEGEESGEPQPFDLKQFLAEVRAERGL